MLNHIISDRGSIYICDMYVCLCAFAWMYVWYIGILYAKAFLGFSMDLSSSIQLENVGFINWGGNCWHKQGWSKELIKHVHESYRCLMKIDEDPFED